MARNSPKAYLVAFKNINAEIVKRAAVKVKVRLGQPGLDVGGWRKVLIYQHSMHDIFESNGTEPVSLLDAENSFKSINRQPPITNIKYICLSVAMFLRNCYIILSRSFVHEGKRIIQIQVKLKVT